jgi:hypothetical protein
MSVDLKRAAPTINLKRAAPTIVAGVFATVYVIVSPPSFDLAAHELRAKLFSAEGFGIWNNLWYAGHHTPGYSVLFPPLSAALTPQLVAAIAATATAALFEPLARRHFGEDAWLGAVWFGAATAVSLYTGRLAFAFGLLPAVGCALALQRERWWLAASCAVLTALASPVAALFAALVAAAFGLGAYVRDRDRRRTLIGLGVAAAALVPVLLLAIAFPEGGSEPFMFWTLWPIPVIAIVALLALPKEEVTLRIGIVLYAVACIAAYLISSPVGSNAARLGALMAGPLAALIWWRRQPWLLAAAALPLLYLQWQPPVRDVSRSANDPSAASRYYRPLLAFLERQSGPPFRVEIPFTGFHWEAYVVAQRFPLARGWERQLDIKYNHLFYGGALTPETYHAWLRELAVRFVAVADDVKLDYSAHRETALIDAGLAYLKLVATPDHWHVYAVADATPIVQGAARLRAYGADSLTMRATRAGTAYVRVHFTPYWAIGEGSGCVEPWGDFTKLALKQAGPVKLVIRFSVGRIRATSPRCT